MRELWRDPEGRTLVGVAATSVAVATAFYAVVERLSIFDALYLAVITITTVGYGDLAPTTDAGKLFTMVYVITGVGVLMGIFSRIAHHTAHAFDRPRPDGDSSDRA